MRKHLLIGQYRKFDLKDENKKEIGIFVNQTRKDLSQSKLFPFPDKKFMISKELADILDEAKSVEVYPSRTGQEFINLREGYSINYSSFYQFGNWVNKSIYDAVRKNHSS